MDPPTGHRLPQGYTQRKRELELNHDVSQLSTEPNGPHAKGLTDQSLA
jgi:hypothetical protein